MSTNKPDARWRTLPLVVSLCALTCAAPAFGQSAANGPTAAAPAKPAEQEEPKLSDKKPTAPSAVVNLVNMLVKKGVLKEEQAQALIKEAEQEAYVTEQAAKDANSKADDAAKAAGTAAAAANPPGTKHVTYVPEYVKQQLTEAVKQEVMAKAQKENWAAPGLYPEWISRIRFYGDLRGRYERAFFPSGNDPGGVVNFNAINTGAPFLNVSSGGYNPPYYDATQDRNEFQISARLGMKVDISDGLTGNVRFATGNDNSPVSTNQTFGGNGGSTDAGMSTKYEAWLDRAALRYEHGFGPVDFAVSFGRFDNPFWSPTELVWYGDLAFDGAAFQATYALSDRITPFMAVGAFPIFNTNFNASINLDDPTTGQPIDLPSDDKYLFGGQFGVRAEIAPNYIGRFAVAYFDFDNVQGELSSPCSVEASSDICSTDLNRPTFAQKGNTYMPLRNIPYYIPGTVTPSPLYQYYGLASQFRPLIASGQLDLAHFDPVHVVLNGEFVWNTAFNAGAVSAVAVNNLAGTSSGSLGSFDGGDVGWLTSVTVGDKQIVERWDWNVTAGYKYIESDATIDAFTDPNFDLGGTNYKGYWLGFNLGLAHNVWTQVRWYSATNIAGAPYAVDVLLVDLNARF